MTCSLALVAGLAASLNSVALAGQDESLPIKNITLYRSGVGFFERRALVENDAALQMQFKTEQINDILKSMIILDLDGGMIGTVSYGSKEPLERRLQSFGIDISDDPSLTGVVERLRGAPVKIATPDATITGTVLGRDFRELPAYGKDVPPIKTPFVNVLTDAGLRSVNLWSISSFEILDKELAGELNKALAALAEHRADRVKTVDVSLRGQGARQIVVAYVHEMPVWKTSYRLVLPDAAEQMGKDDASGTAAKESRTNIATTKPAKESRNSSDLSGQPTIQGWAIVENTTDEDWEDVRLSLVAGRPVSFQMDLYEPLHVERPEIPVPMVAGAMPRMYAGGEAFEAKAALRSPAEAAAPAAPRAPRRAGRSPYREDQAGGEAEPALALGEVLDADALTRYAAAAQAQAGEIGEVFQYTLKSPVTVERQRSAMLPILSSAIEGRRVSIYNRADVGEHPMRGVQLTNTTNLQLMPGPISVFDGAAYAGDAQIGHVSSGDKRLLSYAIDLDVTSLAKDEHDSQVRRIRIVDGLIEQQSKEVRKVEYAFSNKDSKRTRTILVEHPKYPGWTLVEPSRPAEETEQIYRFELALDAGAKGTLPVVQEWITSSTWAVTDYDIGTLVAYSKSGKCSQKVVDAVQEAARRQAEINDLRRQIQRLDEERQSIDQEQARIRENMGAIARESDLYKTYMTKLTTQEKRLDEIRSKRDELLTTQARLERELADYLRGLDVE